MKKTLVSLVSEQTIPNVELIKEFGDETGKHLFISTKKMQNQLKWIIKSTDIENYDTIEVDAFDVIDIENKLNEIEFGNEDIIVNITGGTKLMSLVINEHFKKLGATIYYLTGHSKTYLKIFPNRGEQKIVLTKKLRLNACAWVSLCSWYIC